MGAPGRKPKPTNLKRLAGNPGHRPLNEHEPQSQAASTRAPRGRLPVEGKRLWRYLAPRLAELGLLTEMDTTALEMMCLHYATAVQAERLIRREGLVTTGVRGGLVKHPAVQILRDSSTAFRQYAEQFGLTPSSRARIELPMPDEPDELERLLFGRQVEVRRD